MVARHFVAVVGVETVFVAASWASFAVAVAAVGVDDGGVVVVTKCGPCFRIESYPRPEVNFDAGNNCRYASKCRHHIVRATNEKKIIKNHCY